MFGSFTEPFSCLSACGLSGLQHAHHYAPLGPGILCLYLIPLSFITINMGESCFCYCSFVHLLVFEVPQKAVIDLDQIFMFSRL